MLNPIALTLDRWVMWSRSRHIIRWCWVREAFLQVVKKLFAFVNMKNSVSMALCTLTFHSNANPCCVLVSEPLTFQHSWHYTNTPDTATFCQPASPPQWKSANEYSTVAHSFPAPLFIIAGTCIENVRLESLGSAYYVINSILMFCPLMMKKVKNVYKAELSLYTLYY